MSSVRAVQWIFLVSATGVVFSGVLTFREMVLGTATCTVDRATGAILGLPACAYGLVMYAVIAVLSGSALWARRHEPSRHVHA